MITLVLHLVRLFPFLCGGHRPPARPGEPRLASAARRVHTFGASAQIAHDGLPLVGWAGQSLGRLEAGSGHRVARHGPAVAAPSLPGALDEALRPPSGGPPADQRGDHRPHQKNDGDESPVGRPENPWRTQEARHRGGRANRLPADAEAAPLRRSGSSTRSRPLVSRSAAGGGAGSHRSSRSPDPGPPAC